MSTTSSREPGCLGALFGIFSRPGSASTPAELDEQASPAGPLPYRIRDDFLSPAEISLYHVLCSITQDVAIVCPKVGLKDIFFTANAENRQAHFNRIARKHVDFLLCQPGSMHPLVGVELDDRSHSAAHRQERDDFVDRVFADAQLPLVRVVARRSYNPAELRALVEPYLTGTAPAPSEPAQPDTTGAPSSTLESPPLCPKCGVPMVLRTASRGRNQGGTFFGCRNYPQCREIQSVAIG